MMNNFYFTSTGPENLYNSSKAITDNGTYLSNYTNTQYRSCNSKLNIEGKFYRHITSGKILKVIANDNNIVTFESGDSCSMKNFLQFWLPYISDEEKVNHPSHYTWLKDLCGIEVIDITRHLDFNLGNSIKYILRSGHKREEGYTDKQKTIEDLKKAVWYLNDEIKLLSNE